MTEDPRTRRRLALLALALPLAAALQVRADDPHARCRELAAHAAQPGPVSSPAAGSLVDVELVDAELLDQDGRRLHLATEVVGDRIVVVSFVYTSCTTVCPAVSARLTRLQARLGERLGQEVRLVSLSIDPRRDTPARLKAYATRHRAGPGWVHLTGRPDVVERVLRGLGASSPSLADHAPVTLVGDGGSRRWTRINGFPSADQVIAAVDARSEARRRLAAGSVGP